MYDIIVAGGGPAGSTAAREAAAAGARVLLLDRAAFPRDKPCGGGVNVRAAALLPFGLTPVIERTVTGVRFSLRTHGDFTRRYDRPLTFMTQRSRLDAFLVEQAIRAGVEVHERDALRTATMDQDGVTVRSAKGVYRTRVLIGADGANGVVARSVGLDGGRDLAVAYEGNVRFPGGLPAEWRETAALDLGLIPGGYGWLFPKSDHVNVGVGGWKYLAPSFRDRLTQVVRHYGLAPEQLGGLRGHHLPVRRRGARIVHGRVVLAGDAAGLVDPLSGEGIYAAIASGRIAARHALSAIVGTLSDLSGYQREIDARLGPELQASAKLQDIFNLAPPLYVALLRRSDLLWTLLCRIIRGEGDYATFVRRSGPFAIAIDGLSWLVRHTRLGRVAGRPEWYERPAGGPR
jgi:geranylgeranyl reductase family protein